MIQFTIDKKFLGTEKNLLVSDTMKWIDESLPYHYNGDLSNLDMLFKLSKVESPTQPKNIIDSINIVMKNHDCEYIQWKKFVGNDFYKVWLSENVSKIRKVFENEDIIKYFNESWEKHTKLFESLQKAKINSEKLRLYLNLEKTNKHVLTSFFPDTNGYAQFPVYNRLDTRTGRLTIDKGPSILTLKKEWRDIISPSSDNRKIISVDFSSLEARIAYGLKNKDKPADDIYEHIRGLLGNDFTRSQVKIATISLLYGMNEGSLVATLGGKDQAKTLLKEIKKIFKIKAIEEELRGKVSGGTIKNYYGRVIEVPEDRLIINSYIQSTGVEIALHGFSNLINELKHTDVRPLYVLHDALILDVPRDVNLNDTRYKESTEHIPGWGIRFPVQVTNFY